MADDNKVTIVIDADTGQFTAKMGDVQKNLESTKTKGEGSMGGMSLAAIGFNQVLEAGQKLLALWEESLDNMARIEAFQNQETALKNVGALVGLTTEQTKTLADLVQRSTDGTVSSIKAQDAAFRLLNAGFKAETIPNLTQYAATLERARGIPFDQTIHAFETALVSGRTLGLAPFEIYVNKAGTATEIASAIVQKASEGIAKFGDGYVDTAAKLKAKSEEAWHSVKTFFSGMTEAVGINLFGDKVDQANLKLDSLKKQLADVDAAQAKGFTTMTTMPGLTTQVTTIEQARQIVLEKIADTQKLIAESKKSELDDTKKLQDTISQPKELPKPVTLAAQKRQEAIVTAEIEAGMYAKSESTAQAHYQAKKQLIDLEFQDRIQKMAAEPQTQAQFHAKLLALEQEKSTRIRALRVSDLDFQIAQENAQLAAIEKNSRGIENSQERHQALMIQIEDREFKDEQQKLRMAGLDKANFNRQMETAEEAHEARIQAIKQKHMQLTTDNIKRGWFSAMADMEKRQGGWAGMTQRLGQQSQQVMSKSFIDMAKAHKFSMDQMLNNFLEMIGESMIEDGSFKLLAGIFPPNPAMLAVGAAEVAAGAALVGASSSPTASASGGSSTGATNSTGQPTNPSTQQMQQKSAQIIINGDLLNSRETANHISEILRNNSDITDYAIVAQGKQF